MKRLLVIQLKLFNVYTDPNYPWYVMAKDENMVKNLLYLRGGEGSVNAYTIKEMSQGESIVGEFDTYEEMLEYKKKLE